MNNNKVIQWMLSICLYILAYILRQNIGRKCGEYEFL